LDERIHVGSLLLNTVDARRPLQSAPSTENGAGEVLYASKLSGVAADRVHIPAAEQFANDGRR
jgi:hypothetical protein